MKYKGIPLQKSGNFYKQVSRKTARKHFENGDNLLLHPSNLRFDNIWQSPMSAHIDNNCCIQEEDRSKRFDQLCHDFMFYNCDNERGKYINYFVEITKKEARKM